MEQHAIPRQITTFEFKLIGFMTLKQFIILAMFGLVGLLTYFIFGGNIIGIILGGGILGLGAIVALIPIQDRMIDEWAVLLFKGMNSNTRYTYQKNNSYSTLYYLHDLYFTEDPHRILAHIESKEKLNAYLAAQRQEKQQNNKQRQHIQTLMQHSTRQLQARQFQPSMNVVQGQEQEDQGAGQSYAVQSGPALQQVSGSVPQQQNIASSGPQTPLPSISQQTSAPQSQQQGQQLKHPFLTGIIKNNRRIPLPGILVYIKDSQNNPIRILKTNPHGVFATYMSLPVGTYVVEIRDPNKQYFFDTMNIQIESHNPKPFMFQSKEML